MENSNTNHNVLIAVAQSKIESMSDSIRRIENDNLKRIELRLEAIENKLENRVEEVDKRIDSIFNLAVTALVSAIIAALGTFLAKPNTSYAIPPSNTRQSSDQVIKAEYKEGKKPVKQLPENHRKF